MNEATYLPIDCHFYDELEAAAVKKINSSLRYLGQDKQEMQIQGRIVDFIHINKAEYLVLEDGFKLRLDKIITLNDKTAPKNTCNISDFS